MHGSTGVGPWLGPGPDLGLDWAKGRFGAGPNWGPGLGLGLAWAQAEALARLGPQHGPEPG